MPGAHQSDDQIEQLMQGLRRLSVDDEKADPPIPTVPLPTEFSQDANASPVLPQRPTRFRTFSDLESESRFTYLSNLLNHKPLDLPFLWDSAAQPCFQTPAEITRDRVEGSRWGKRGKAHQP